MRLHDQEEVLLTAASSAAEWDQAATAAPGATVFHSYEFLQAVAPSLGCRFVPLLVIHRGRQAGAAPLLIKRLGPFSTINWVPFPYLGPLVPEPLVPATLRALRAEARRRRAVNHQQSFCQAIADPGADGFAARVERTFVVPLTGRTDEDLLAAMHNGHRWQIRRARRAGIEVRPAQPGDFRLMDTWLGQMYEDRGMRNGNPPGTARRVFEGLRAGSCSFSHAALAGERTVAVHLTLADSRQALGWQIAVDPAFRAERPQALLVWRALQHARDLGIAEFDMVGAPSDGIATYKRRFGARERSYTVLQRQAGVHRMAHSAAGRLGWAQAMPRRRG